MQFAAITPGNVTKYIKEVHAQVLTTEALLNFHLPHFFGLFPDG